MSYKKFFLSSVTALALATTPAMAKATAQAARVVDFTKCYSESSYGQKEQEANNQMKDQMEKAINELNSQLSETSEKLNDEAVRDSLSPEAEKELQQKMQTLSAELQRYQQQYYYMMQQAQYRTMNIMADHIKKASTNVAKANGYDLIINKDQVFHFTTDLDVTSAVIKELDAMFKADNAKSESSALPKKEAK